MTHDEGAAEADFSWPPSDQELEACAVILRDAGGPGDAERHVVRRLSEVVHPPAAPDHRRHSSAAVPAPRFRHWGVEHPEASYPFHVESDRPLPDASSAGEAWRAVLALAAGLSLAVLSYAQFHGARGELAVPVLTALAPAASSDALEVGPVTDAPDIVVRAVSSPASAERRRREDRDADAVAEDRPSIAALASRVFAAQPQLDGLAASAIPVESHDLEAPDTPAPIAPAVEERAAAPEPTAVTAAYVEPAPRDEDRIRAALTRWRTAYSALDARAAREVWPSVDARALARAFQALKSQELRFDRCQLTVDGGSAQAACTGRAIYVPRVGNQSPRATPHEWTFELKKSNQRWTIASARSS